MPPGDLVAEPGSALVFLGGHGLGQLLGQRLADLILLAERFLQFAKLVDQFVRLELLFGLGVDEDLVASPPGPC